MIFDDENKFSFEQLEFKAEDFFPAGATLDYWKKEIADEANRILSEKLTPLLAELEELRKLKEEVERAPEVFSDIRDTEWYGKWRNVKLQGATHKARLVCIEELK